MLWAELKVENLREAGGVTGLTPFCFGRSKTRETVKICAAAAAP